MESLEILKAQVGRNFFCVLNSHPLGFFFGITLLVLLLIRVYCRFKVVMCKCDEDMTGKTVIVTGGNAGIGKETALDLARRNARVILGCRSMERGTKAVKDIIAATGNPQVILKHLDLNSFASVRAFADDVIKTEPGLHVLINNAGLAASKKSTTEDGWNTVMQSNHLGHFLLTNLLLDLLKSSSPSRIINVSSLLYLYGNVNPDDLNCKKMNPFSHSYCESKMANVLFTRELSERMFGTGVTVNAIHPGVVKTKFASYIFGIEFLVTKFLQLVAGKTPLEGAQTSIHLAMSPALRETTGKFFSDCKEIKLIERAKNKGLARRLWKSSAMAVALPEVTKSE